MATRHGDRAKQREKVTREYSAEKGEETESEREADKELPTVSRTINVVELS